MQVTITEMREIFKAFIEQYGWEIGAHTYCPSGQGRPNVRFFDSGAKLKIGKYCSLACNITFMLGGNHRTDWITTYPFTQIDGWNAEHIPGHPATKGDIIIGNDVYIGSGAWIMSGVTIGDGAVIGAMSVVTNNVEPYTIAAGNPAVKVRHRIENWVEVVQDGRFPFRHPKSRPDKNNLLKINWWDWPEDKIRAALPLLCSGDVTGLMEFHRTYLNPPGTPSEQ